MSADLAVEAALAAQPELAATVAGELLARSTRQRVPPGAGGDGAVLPGPRQAGAGGGDALHVHVNTVRYRLERLAELTGTGVHDAPRADRSHVVDTAGTWWALRTWLGR
ncbi:helix-turn-helix domain-containing protein [Saccharopolyspora gregorii]